MATYFESEEPSAAPPSLEKPFMVNVADLPWQALGDPGLDGRIPDVRGRKLDLAVTRLAPGSKGSDFHFHYASDELFYVLEGGGDLRYGNETSAVRPGDVISCPPGPDGAHQMRCCGDLPLVYLAISTVDFDGEICEYPDSGKICLAVPNRDKGFGHYYGVYGREDAVDDLDGELD